MPSIVFTSKSKDESFLSPMIFEYVLTVVLTFIGTGLISAWGFGRLISRRSNDAGTAYITNHFLILVLIVAVIATLASVIAVYKLRNAWQSVEFIFDDDAKLVRLTRRKISKKSMQALVIPYTKFFIQKDQTKGFLFVAKYQGQQIYSGDEKIGWLLHDHFTWEEQVKDYRGILEKGQQIQAQSQAIRDTRND